MGQFSSSRLDRHLAPDEAQLPLDDEEEVVGFNGNQMIIVKDNGYGKSQITS